MKELRTVSVIARIVCYRATDLNEARLAHRIVMRATRSTEHPQLPTVVRAGAILVTVAGSCSVSS
jgi:hypothetical protein